MPRPEAAPHSSGNVASPGFGASVPSETGYVPLRVDAADLDGELLKKLKDAGMQVNEADKEAFKERSDMLVKQYDGINEVVLDHQVIGDQPPVTLMCLATAGLGASIRKSSRSWRKSPARRTPWSRPSTRAPRSVR